MAFPNDLPDLAALNPPANEKPAGVYDSFYAQSQSGNLPASYIV
jgi:hypothetical protein